MKLMNNKHGSSLILVLLVIAGILTVVFGAQRVTLVQFSQSNREEDNVSAYYAARAGIEDGLLRYRFNRDAEIETGKVYRFSLTSGESMGEVNKSEPVKETVNYDPTNQYYDLSLTFKDTQVNMNADKTPNFGSSPTTAKDGFLELTGFATGSTTYLRSAFKFLKPGTTTNENCINDAAFVQIERRSETGTLTHFQAPKPVGNDPDDFYDSAPRSENIQADTADSIRIRPFHCDIKYAFNTAKNNSTNGSGINAGPVFDSLVARITAIGYYGDAKRTLLATVDRNTGRLLDIYDFNALAGEDIRQIP